MLAVPGTAGLLLTLFALGLPIAVGQADALHPGPQIVQLGEQGQEAAHQGGNLFRAELVFVYEASMRGRMFLRKVPCIDQWGTVRRMRWKAIAAVSRILGSFTV